MNLQQQELTIVWSVECRISEWYCSSVHICGAENSYSNLPRLENPVTKLAMCREMIRSTPWNLRLWTQNCCRYLHSMCHFRKRVINICCVQMWKVQAWSPRIARHETYWHPTRYVVMQDASLSQANLLAMDSVFWYRPGHLTDTPLEAHCFHNHAVNTCSVTARAGSSSKLTELNIIECRKRLFNAPW